MLKEIGKNAKIHVHWKVNPYDYSLERQNSLITKVSNKYGLTKDKVRIIPEFIQLNNDGDNISVVTDVISNIQNPKFQIDLFKEYLTVNNVEDYDFELIKNIDSSINSKIDYDVYDKYRNYSIKWIKWSNFLSYGENNFFDFSKLNGLVLLNGEPANQSGKTTFAIDLIHFLLFGNTDKASTQDKIFNKFNKEATEVVVEGCLVIDNEEYIIKRKLTRPKLKSRTSKSKTSQKVEYYKIVGDSLEELNEYIEDKQEEDSRRTNKVIKEAIGNESDFDMIICATSSNLDDLIEKKDTERGKLLSRWIGLLPIEQKNTLAREKFNGDIKPNLLSNRYNIETLNNEIDAFNIRMKELGEEMKKLSCENDSISSELSRLENEKTCLIQAKSSIDETILKLDATTLSKKIENLMNDGKRKNFEIEQVESEINEIGDVEFSMDEFEKTQNMKSEAESNIAVLRHKCLSIKNEINVLKTSEYCPTCGRKYENIDNTDKIKEKTDELNSLIEDGKTLSTRLNVLCEKITSMKDSRAKYELKSKNTIKLSALKLNVEKLRNEYKESLNLLKEYNKNTEAIDKNNKLDIGIRNVDIQIKGKMQERENNIKLIQSDSNEINYYLLEVSKRKDVIEEINKEAVLLRNWKIYLEMVGKNGISKMVLRKTLPIINAQISELLSDICDFDVEIVINEKNDVMFYLVKDGVMSELSSGSGFEKTSAALALRIVLGNISTLPRLDGIILDELWGRVAKENLENMHKVLDKILSHYKYIIQISHLDEVKDWNNTIITVTKENNISKLVVVKDKK